MTVEFVRRTVAAEVRFEGLGLHSGVPVQLVVHPSKGGLWFRLGEERVEAKAANVTETTRCTRLGPISTIEHLMSALAGLEITDAEIEMSAGECPALDGSSLEFANGLLKAGTTEIGRSTVDGLYTRVFVQEPDCKMGIAKGEGHWRYSFLTGERWPREQIFEVENVCASYLGEIAPARTFGFEEEIPMIQQAGLAKGLDFEKALVLGKEGYVNEPRFADEPARHKMLDAIGDLLLSGLPPSLLSVTMEKTGHKAHVKAALKLSKAVKIESVYL
ncbi:MAG: UDP-3-O-acyl-N-acetylglucosamine deacetylase [Fimbriimonadaceae bacterium]|nr:UDP-3-O-acyl-N-acetylglucosamine deacetylase [Fimbriimonadaceae bacterium]